MTTLTLTIGGSNFLPQYKTGSFHATSQIQNQGDIANMTIIQKPGQSAPLVGKEFIFKDGTRFLFGGFITKVTPVETGVGQLIEYDVEISDYTYLLVNKFAQNSYANQTLNYIVTDIVTKGVTASYGLTLGGVATGPVIPTIAFNHIPLRQCFENLQKVTGYIWRVGYDKVISFVDPSSTTLAPETITDTSKNHSSLVIIVDSTQVRNDIIVEGGTQASNPYTQTIKGDGAAREWVLVYPVVSLTSVKINGVTQTVGQDGVDAEASFNVMFDANRGAIRLSFPTATPTSSDTVEAIFTYPVPVIVDIQGAPEIAAMKALEGGNGVHQYLITDPTILSKSQAQQRALQEIANFGSPTVSGTFITRTGLLTAGSYFAPGQILTVNSPAWGINSDTTYTIQKVVTKLQETGSSIEYTYEVTFGGRLLGVVDFLQALATPETPTDSSGEIEQIHAMSEQITAVDSASIGLKTTPPFKWGTTGTKPGVWNKSEWS